MKKFFFLILIFFSTLTSYTQNNFIEEEVLIPSKTIDVQGSLLYNPENKNIPLAIIIQGSGPTDRNTNSSVTKINTNASKYLAEDLAKQNIATYRYDKSAIADLSQKKIDYATYSFDEFVTDAKNVVAYFKKSHKFSEIYIIGHSQGSLVGMLASTKDVDGFISLAGLGNSADIAIIDQVSKQAPFLKEPLVDALTKIKNKEKVTDYPPLLASLLNPSIQYFLGSYIVYNPQEEIKKLNIPVLIINGTKDLQVSVNEAELLQKAKPEAKLLILENMNHVMKTIEGDTTENYAAYSQENPKPNTEGLAKGIVEFIHKK